jgi:hypothetical protein
VSGFELQMDDDDVATDHFLEHALHCTTVLSITRNVLQTTDFALVSLGFLGIGFGSPCKFI